MVRNSLIDGWRGLSVSFVIVGHLVGYRFQEEFQVLPFRYFSSREHFDLLSVLKQILMRLLIPLPEAGVNVFFVISGFLITSLLMREERDRGRVSLGAFYVRRIFRIFPALVCYLIVLGFLVYFEIISIPLKSFLLSSLFLCDVPGQDCTWWLGHTWSLSVEEQYYVAWPILFIFFRGSRSVFLGIVFSILVVSSILFPLALSFAYIAIGGLYALSGQLKLLVDRIATGRNIAICSIAILLNPMTASVPAFHFLVSAAQPAMLAVVFFGTLNGRGMFFPVVRSLWLRRLGVISYSTYLWQQLTTGPYQYYSDNLYLSIPIVFFVPSILSYLFVEKNFIRIGHRQSEAIKARSTPISAAV